MKRSMIKTSRDKATYKAPVGALLSTDARSPDEELGVKWDEIAVEARQCGRAVPSLPEASTRRKKRSNVATFHWSNDDNITLLNALIHTWKELEDSNERPPESDILSMVNSRCGNRFPPTIRHHLNNLIKKYGGKNIKKAKKNLTEYKTLLWHIREKILPPELQALHIKVNCIGI